ncbi:rhamnogalacturonan acetylesterase [Streptomyces sp. GC420]|uniref:rhamnogalacturonan acetylesterase n=1 Tax=Streptomyces sp. GC420 TaxID=2697568 RepID=UPI00141508FC|nr:rhamnogalacturonan acetylesterase [Streptomyces sp. GC420]NBM18303.1 rhamnogalacturonan acetylesterase [Streptomyces sp. GC420]
MSITRRRTAAAFAAVPLALAAPAFAAAHGRGGRGPRTLYIAGDSTAAQKYAPAAPETGWGMALPFFLTPYLRVSNHAVNGRSSKSFLDEGRLAPILGAIRPGDWLLIQFGHNDEKTTDPARGTDPCTTYQDCLLQYVKGARERGARPVLLTPVERRRFGADHRAVATHGEYPEAMRRLAAEEGVALVDAQAASIALWQSLGPEASMECFNRVEPGESPNYPDGKQDNTHFSPRGAIEVARLTARALRERGVLAPHDVRRLDEAVPADRITWSEGPVA